MTGTIEAGALNGRVAVVTGASSGIGAATAERFAELGASVALLARRADRLDAVVKGITDAGGRAIAVPTDVTDRAAVERAHERIADEFGRVDLVFANAGRQLISRLADLQVDDWDDQIELNIQGVMNTTRAWLHDLRAAGAAGTASDLIITSSIAATRVLPKFQVYSATKAYLTHFVQMLRVEVGPEGVRVTSVAPGMVNTELPDHVTDPDATKLMADLIRDIDVLESEDVAETVAFVAAVPKHVNLTEITILPTAQTV